MRDATCGCCHLKRRSPPYPLVLVLAPLGRGTGDRAKVRKKKEAVRPAPAPAPAPRRKTGAPPLRGPVLPRHYFCLYSRLWRRRLWRGGGGWWVGGRGLGGLRVPAAPALPLPLRPCYSRFVVAPLPLPAFGSSSGAMHSASAYNDLISRRVSWHFVKACRGRCSNNHWNDAKIMCQIGANFHVPNELGASSGACAASPAPGATATAAPPPRLGPAPSLMILRHLYPPHPLPVRPHLQIPARPRRSFLQLSMRIRVITAVFVGVIATEENTYRWQQHDSSSARA
jgi:hypothetical protein